MKKLLVVIITLGCVHVFGQDNFKEKLAGEWSTFLGSGDSAIFHFNADGTMFLVSPDGTNMGNGEIKLNDGRIVKPLMRYAINANSQPIQIDIYYSIDTYYNVVGKAEGIIELLDDNLLRIAINYNRPRPVRPENFDNPTEAGVLSRLGKKIDPTDCEKFKKGKFKMIDAFTGTTLIVRDHNFQTESNDIGDKVKLKIEWTSDCTYTLTPIEFYVNNVWRPDTTEAVLTIHIIKAKKDSYIYSSENNKTKRRVTRELFIAKD